MKKLPVISLVSMFCAIFASCLLGAGQTIRLGKTDNLRQENLAQSLSVWRDPVFQKRFAESYMAETEIEPVVTTNERDVMLKVLELISQEKMGLALELLGEQKGEHTNAVFDFTAANIHFQNERLDAAVSSYKIAVAKYPRFRRAWKNLAMIRVRQNDFKNALPALTQVISLGGSDAITYGLLGFCYANVGNDIAAESAFRMANLLSPETMDWKMGMARSFFKQGRFADASSLCRTLIKDNPEQADLWLLLANAHVGLQKPLKAAEDLEIIKRLGKATPASLNLLGDIYVNEELYSLAVTSYLAALDQDKNSKPNRVIRAAKVLAARSALGEAAELIAQIDMRYGARLSKAEQKDLLKIRARIAVANGSSGDEVAVLQAIIELDPLDGEALILLGKHHARTENPEKAIFFYERAANLEKFEADAKVFQAQVLVGQGKYNTALPLLRRAQVIKPRENIRKYMEQVERIAKKR